ncbi:MAG: ABC transporter permease [Verrucomicrobia bacterium]|nr:ABC transporter permease [Verrucomicrobiota bacterium]
MKIIIELLAASVRIATPLLLAALGGILSECAGTFAVGIEGMMLMGAFAGVVATYSTHNLLLGLFASAFGGAALASIIATATACFRADQMVTGLASNILSLGLTSFLVRGFFGGQAPVMRLAPLPAISVPILSRIPVLGEVLFQQPALTYAAFLLVLPVHFLLVKTQIGLTMRAVGENPAAAFAVGSDPIRVRMAAIIAGGVLAGLGGAELALQELGTFTDGMTNGRGFIALAAIIVGRWQPLKVMIGCLLFGTASALALNMQGWGLPVSSYVLQMAPYVIALAVLIGIGRGVKMPAAIGRSFTRD